MYSPPPPSRGRYELRDGFIKAIFPSNTDLVMLTTDPPWMVIPPPLDALLPLNKEFSIDTIALYILIAPPHTGATLFMKLTVLMNALASTMCRAPGWNLTLFLINVVFDK
jgi:hypothetical protein